MEKKITKRDYFNAIKDLANGKDLTISIEDVIKFADKEIALLDKKNASRKTTLTETQKENLDFEDKIVEFLSNGEEKTCTQIAKEFALSTQRTSPILEKLIKSGRVEKNMVKRVNYFKLVA